VQWQGEPSRYLVSHHGGEKYNPIHVNFVNLQICAMHLYQGIRMCLQCSGECVIWQESVDEQPWEKVRSRYPFLLYLLCSPCPLWFAVSLSRSTAYCFPENLQALTETALWLWIVKPIGIQVFLVTFTDDWSNITWYDSYTRQIGRYTFGFLCIHVFEKNIPVHTLSYILSVFAVLLWK